MKSKLLSIIIGALLLTGIAGCDQPGETFRLKLENVEVDTARESSGDRPYFNTISFRSQFNTAGSTEVDLRSREPNDWVGKTLYNYGSLPDGHMHPGDNLVIPWWMGEHEWRDVKVIPLLDILSDRTPEVVGAIVVSLDNNNTPPHVVRDILTDFTNIMRTVMVSQIEQGMWIASLTDPLSFFQTLLDAITSEVQALDLFGYLFQLTIGSTFNPDQPTGIEIFIMPGVEGLTTPLSAEVPVPGLPGGEVTVKLTVLPVTDAVHATNYQGSNANYLVNMSLDHDEDEDASLPITSLNLKLKTGGDDLREGSQVSVDVQFCEGGELQTQSYPNINGGANFNRWADNSFTLPLFGIPVNDVKQINLNWVPDSDLISNDNWDLEVVKFGYNRLDIEGTYFVRHGRPLMRFTDDDRGWGFRFGSSGCGS